MPSNYPPRGGAAKTWGARRGSGGRKGKDEKGTTGKIKPCECVNLPPASQRWHIVFNILEPSGGGKKKEQRCRVGCLEESSAANSTVDIIPNHLLPARGRAIFVLCCAHAGPVAEEERHTEWARRASEPGTSAKCTNTHTRSHSKNGS